MSAATPPVVDVSTVDRQVLAEAVTQAKAAYEQYTQAGLALDITRGKPCSAQLDLAEGLLDNLQQGEHSTPDAGDLRNYGGAPKGLAQLREIFAPLIQVPADQIVVRDNSSLSLMHQCVSASFFQAPPGGGEGGWMAEVARTGTPVKFLAPAPGYDRHFSVCKELGVELITVPMLTTGDALGPDMDVVEELVAKDASIKGIWCVPKYSNPTGITFSESVVRRLAQMETAAPDFRIYWDNAYAMHHLSTRVEEHDQLADLLALCEQAGHADRAFVFASTSKITFAGAGISFFGSSPANVAWYLSRDGMRSIGPDKINQLRHARFFGSTEGVTAHMDKHAEILAPKFDAVGKTLSAELGALGIAQWTEPRGGYFVNLDVVPGTAKRVIELAKEAGVAVTPAGATYPAGGDPNDENIRIAPSFPTLEEVAPAMKVLTACVVLAAGEKLLD